MLVFGFTRQPYWCCGLFFGVASFGSILLGDFLQGDSKIFGWQADVFRGFLWQFSRASLAFYILRFFRAAYFLSQKPVCFPNSLMFQRKRPFLREFGDIVCFFVTVS